MRKNPILVTLTAIAVLVVLACGGGGGGASTPTGTAVFQIDWPGRSRSLPKYAESVQVTIPGQNPAFVNRVGDAATSRVLQFDNVPSGRVQANVVAFAQTNAQGTSVATATVSVDVITGQSHTVNVTAQLNSPVTHLALSAPSTTLEVTETLQVAATALDASTARPWAQWQ